MTEPLHLRASGPELDAAAEWWVRLDGFRGPIPEVEAEALSAWLAQSPSHSIALEQVRRTMAAVDAPQLDDDLAALAAELRAPSASRVASLSRYWPAVAAAILLLIATGLFFVAAPGSHSVSPERQLIATEAGEHSNIDLADGSRISLDANTAMEVTLTDHYRHVHLLKGQARFVVAHDATRPFIVSAQGRSIVALGTEFNVERTGAQLSVFLLKGRVGLANIDDAAVERDPSGATRQFAVTLSPGNHLTIDRSGRMVLRRNVDWRAAFAWQDGRIVFDDDRLADAVDRLERYGHSRIVIDDPQVANMRMSGVFSTNRPDGFIESVSELLPVAVRTVNGEVHLGCRTSQECNSL